MTTRRAIEIVLAATLASLVAGAPASAEIPAHAPDPAAGNDYRYEPEGKRDPFRPFALQAEPQANAEPLSPLQRYEVGQLKLVGIVLNVTPPRAMVEDDQGLGFILTPGTPVGPNGGIVTAIKPRQVVVVEWQTDVIGEKHRKEYVLELPADEPLAGLR
ncbi:MAG TPA: pilus assembly protein PilP [Candidatus Binatia bacterium]|nr:pilus assembly protein PilP [Candidatus Binatia bacterium]